MNDPRPSRRALAPIRIVVSVIIGIHGWARLLADAVVPFGLWLDGQGIPLGMAVAIIVTALEIVGTPILAFGRLVFPLCLGYIGVYLCGLVMVHAPEGWFVVGLGRNGAEYSVLLITCLLSVALAHVPSKLVRFTRKRFK